MRRHGQPKYVKLVYIQIKISADLAARKQQWEHEPVKVPQMSWSSTVGTDETKQYEIRQKKDTNDG